MGNSVTIIFISVNIMTVDMWLQACVFINIVLPQNTHS